MKKIILVSLLFNAILMSSDRKEENYKYEQNTGSDEYYKMYDDDEELRDLIASLSAYIFSGSAAIQFWDQFGCCDINLCSDGAFLAYPSKLLFDLISTLNGYELTPCKLASFLPPIYAGVCAVAFYKLLRRYRAQNSN